jgi:hypothetical protein
MAQITRVQTNTQDNVADVEATVLETTAVDSTTGSVTINHVDLWPDYSSTPTWMYIHSGVNVSANLAAGLYHAISNTACYFAQGNASVTVDPTGSGAHYLPAAERIKLTVNDPVTRGYVAAVRVTSNGMLQFHKVSGI